MLLPMAMITIKKNCLINLKLQKESGFKFIFWVLALLIKVQQRLLYNFLPYYTINLNFIISNVNLYFSTNIYRPINQTIIFFKDTANN